MRELAVRVGRTVFSRMKIAICAAKYVTCRMMSLRSRQPIWVICERGTDARDNGYAFYRYMIKEHPEVRVFYLIDPNSTDYPKVAAHAVRFGSMEHYRVLAKADRIVSTHCYTALPMKNEKLWYMMGMEKRFYFLQHGVIQAYLPFIYGDRTKMRLFCCTAMPEYKFVKENFRHPEGVVQLTGLARYDHLMDFKTKKQILVMPTWRRYLADEKAFLSSDYYAAWKSLLKDERLLGALEKTDTKLVFYPHYEMQPMLKHFRINHPNVIIANFEHYDVQQLLKESELLVTDYSSVYFDFAYMRKPVVHYQFDMQEYHRRHYREGYFSFEKNGFGPIEADQNGVVEQILKISGNEYRMEEIYRNRIKEFFAYHDCSNCERIYQAIVRQN